VSIDLLIHYTRGYLTRILNNLDKYKHITTPILVTFDSENIIDDNLIYASKKWKLPKLRPQDMRRKLQLRTIQGASKIWYCGTDTSVSGHEGALVSGLVIAEALGAKYPFSGNQMAQINFNMVKDLMGVLSPKEKLCRYLSKLVYRISKISGIQNSQITRILMDLYT